LGEARGHHRLEVIRGDVVVSSAPGDYGKPRPALVVQSDLFNATHASLVICPITSYLLDAPLFRISVQPSAENGLKADCQVMVDKIAALKRERISKRIGKFSDALMAEVDRALLLWLHLGIVE
jgi:mRNA interferase MazF